jgi:tetratricopeptide (TPR) repeat protein
VLDELLLDVDTLTELCELLDELSDALELLDELLYTATLDELLDELDELKAAELLELDELDTACELLDELLELDDSRSPDAPMMTIWTLMLPLVPWYWMRRFWAVVSTL